MPNISKSEIEQVLSALTTQWNAAIPDGEPAINAAKLIMQGLLTQQEGEPVAIYQYQMANGSWFDQDKKSYDYYRRRGEADVRIVYTHPAPFTPITADMVTDEMRDVVLEHRDLYLSKKCFAAVVNAWGAKK